MRPAEGGWVALPRQGFWGRLVSLGGDTRASLLLLASPLLLQAALYGLRAFTEPSSWWTLVSSLLAAALVGIIVAAFVVQPTISIRSDGTAWRRRRRERSPQELDRARQYLRDGREQLWLAVITGKRIGFTVPVPGRVEPGLDEHQLAAVIALLERAPIELPPKKQDPWDPKGRFAHLDRQGYLAAADAVALLRDPPAVGIAPNDDQRKEPRKGGVDRYPWSEG